VQDLARRSARDDHGNRPDSSNLTVDGAFNLDAGANGGASTNVVTRSGGNDIHGPVFEFLRKR
jgi:hypothetical protein